MRLKGEQVLYYLIRNAGLNVFKAFPAGDKKSELNVVFVVFAAEGTECKTPTGVPAGDSFNTNSSYRQQSEVGNQVNVIHVPWRSPVTLRTVHYTSEKLLLKYISTYLKNQNSGFCNAK